MIEPDPYKILYPPPHICECGTCGLVTRPESRYIKGHHYKIKGRRASEETKKKLSMSRTGEKNPFYGKHHTKETKEKLGNHWKEKKQNGWINPRKGKSFEEQLGTERAKQQKEALSKFRTGRPGLSGEKNGMYGKSSWNKGLAKELQPNTGKRVTDFHKPNCTCNWCLISRGELSPQAVGSSVPSKMEIEIFTILNTLYPDDWIPNFDCKFRVGYNKTKKKYPDIYHKSKKIVIEVNGVFWHIEKRNTTREKEENRLIDLYKGNGMKCICIWEDDYKTSSDKIDFIKNKIGGIKVDRSKNSK